MKQKTIKTIELVNFLHHLINEKKLLISSQSIVLAVSGGQDSICLFFIFLQLKTQWNWNFSLIYCNHLWQKDSFYTMLHIFKLAYLLNVPINLTITLEKVLSEQKARNWRSLTFQRITQFYLFSVIVTGHSKSDQIETGLFNIFRGSGTKGVSSLNWIKVVNKRCSFKLNKTQLKELKILYQTETNPNILLRSRLKSPKEFSSGTKIIKSNVRERSQKRFLRFVSNKIKKKISIKRNLLRSMIFQTSQTSRRDTKDVRKIIDSAPAESMTLYKSVNNDLLFFDCVSKITYLENNVLLVLTSKSCQKITFCICKKEQITLGDVRCHNVPLTSSLLMSGFASITAFGLQIFRLSVNKKRSFKFVKIKQEEIEIFPLYKSEYTLIRPFLSLSRFDLKKLCISWKIPLFPDQSNQKVKYQRNRIRKQLLPTLRFFFNPQIDTVLYQFIDIIKNEEEYINFITARIVKRIEQKKEKSVELETSLFAVLPIAIRRKILKHFLNNIMKKSLTFFDVEKFLKQISVYKSVKPQKSILKKQNKINKNIFKNFVLNSSNPPLTYYKGKVVNTQLTSLKEISNVRGITESLFVKGKPTEKKVLRVYFAHQRSYKSSICIIKHNWVTKARQTEEMFQLLSPNIFFSSIPDIPKGCQGCLENHENFSIPFAQLQKQTNKIADKKPFLSFTLKTKNLPLLANQRCVSSILQKDILFNIINKKKSIYKEYKLMFFPKTGSIFLEAQRLFFIKNKRNVFNAPD